MNALKLAEEWKDRADDCGRLARALLASSETAPSVEWLDEHGCKWSFSVNESARELKAFYDAWPMGLEEIESSIAGHKRIIADLETKLATPSAIAPITANVAAYTDRIGELEEVLHELVTLKHLHDEIERIAPKDLSGPRNYHAEDLEEDYKNRKPKAWQRAREVLE